MHRFFGEQDAYSLFVFIGIRAILITNFFYYKSKKKAMSVYSQKLIALSSKTHKYLGVGVGIFLFILETYLATVFTDKSTQYNGLIGSLVGTGGNYFGILIFFPIYMLLFSLLFAINPFKEIDIMTMGLPVFLFFVKLACFFNGCCWGVEWEHGLYNYHYDHPGYQVPVQAIEAFWAALILVILLIYRRKAKVGTIYPMYLTLFCFTRFFSEFFKADYPDVIGPFKVYHIMCMVGFVIGLILLIVMKKYGEKISAAYDVKLEKAVDGIIQKIKEKIAEERNDYDDDEYEEYDE
ncbi:MAG: prolipoprotein diacylglyceryl transferase [Clostridia bacterium]|nr:prolipoprotein diacylglyceryl transferase [Clostridia bacterium]